MKKLIFLINPVSGGGRCLSKFKAVRQSVEAAAIPYEVHLTEYPGHASQLAREHCRTPDSCIVSVGGDGTVREIAQELVGTEVPLGILPFGTGNDLVKALGISTEPMEALDCLLHGVATPIDAAMANDKLFLNVSGLGFDVAVLQRAHSYKEKVGSALAYVLGAFHALLDQRSYHVTITTPEEVFEQDVLILSVGNGIYIGGGMKATPLASPSDGLLDLCFVDAVSRLKTARCLLKFFKGEHIHLDITHYRKVTELRVESNPRARVQLDGEIMEQTPVTFRLLPAALSVLCPAKPAGRTGMV